MKKYGLLKLQQESDGQCFVGVDFNRTILQTIVDANCDGIIIQNDAADCVSLAAAKWLKDQGKEVIWYASRFSVLERPFLQRVSRVTLDIAYGYAPNYEFKELADPLNLFKRLKQVEIHRGNIRWWCPLNPLVLVNDYHGDRKLRDVLLSTQTPCLLVGGHVLLAYLFNDMKRFPGVDMSSLFGLKLNADYGMTLEGLAGYLDGLTMITGTGGQTGYAAGAFDYAEKAGFTGAMIQLPFDLTIKAETKENPETYPESVGSAV